MAADSDMRPIVSRKALRLRAQELAASSGEDLTLPADVQPTREAVAIAERDAAVAQAISVVPIDTESTDAVPTETVPTDAVPTAPPSASGKETPVRRSTVNRGFTQPIPATPPAAKPMRATRLQAKARSELEPASSGASPSMRATAEPPTALVGEGGSGMVAASSVIRLGAVPVATPPTSVKVVQASDPPAMGPEPMVVSEPEISATLAFDAEPADQVESVAVTSIEGEPIESVAEPMAVPAQVSGTFEPAPQWESISENPNWQILPPRISAEPLPGQQASQTERWGEKNPRPSAGYTWLHYLILIAVAFVLGLLIWQLIDGGTEEPGLDYAAHYVAGSTIVPAPNAPPFAVSSARLASPAFAGGFSAGLASSALALDSAIPTFELEL